MNAGGAKRPDITPFGDELACAAARYLKENRWFDGLGAIVRAHRDYTGHGLFHDHAAGEFFLARSLDSLPRECLLTFPEEPGFTQWLAGQTDLMLSGRVPTGIPQFDLDPDNQRITRQLILDHLARKDAA